jgi:periplasmic protein CpxP/Spy
MTLTVYRPLLGLAFAFAAAGNAFAQTPAGRPSGAGQAPATHAQSPAQTPAPTTPSRAQPNGAWWRSESYKRDLGLTNEQSARLDHIFNDVLPQLMEEANQLDEREGMLSRLIETNADEEKVAHQIDRVETMRSALNKDRQLMLVHMRQVLTPEQRVKFNERWVRFREAQQQPQRQGTPPTAPRPPSAPGGPQRSAQPPPSSAVPTKRPE